MFSLVSTRSVTVAIQIDALRYDYVTEEDAPFLSSLKCQGISGSLVPTFGFEPDAAYFAGLYPEEANGGAHFWYDPGDCPFRFTKFFPSWLDNIPELSERILRKLTSWWARRKAIHPRVRIQASTGRIPFRLLRFFSYSMKYLPFQIEFLENDTIFDILNKEGKQWFYHGSPVHRVHAEDVLQRVKTKLYPPVEFAFIHIGDLDGVGHHFGPDSMERREAMRQVDGCIDTIHRIVSERFDEIHLVIFGDHGMMKVQRHLDLWSRLKRLDLKQEKDYLFFLDSTMARFWFFNEKAKQRIEEFLATLGDGKILDVEDQRRYRIRYPHNRFSDLLFLAHPGVLIFPNFFQNRRSVKGMHGYAPETSEQQSAMVISSPRVRAPIELQRPVDMCRLFPTLLTLMGLPIPSTCEVESLV